MARRRNRSLTTACSENEGVVDVFPLLNLTDELLCYIVRLSENAQGCAGTHSRLMSVVLRSRRAGAADRRPEGVVLPGLLNEYGALQAFLVDVFKAMVFGRRSRQMSTPTKEFYSIIMQNCGQMLHDFVSEMFCGPSSSSTRAFKAAVDYPFMLGLHQDYFKMAATIIKVWKLSDAPFLLSEDGSALQMRIDIAVVKGRAHVFGLCGNSFVVDTVQQFRDAARDLPVATTLYAYTLAPLIEGAPCIPLFAFGHDNSSSTFSTGLAKEIWKYIWQGLKSQGVCLVGHVHDGDRRLVNLGNQLCKYPPLDSVAAKVIPDVNAPPEVQSHRSTIDKERDPPITVDHPII
ncbi:hypothetical protein CEUSTIGMA_g12524.t1, partial [Chlamydomonas eustigma]